MRQVSLDSQHYRLSSLTMPLTIPSAHLTPTEMRQHSMAALEWRGDGGWSGRADEGHNPTLN